MKKFMFSLIMIIGFGSLSAQTIGNNSEGTSSDYPSNAMCAIRYQCAQNMTVDKMYVKIATSGTGNIKCAIYSDNSGKPGTFLMGTDQLTNPGTGWKSFSLTSGLSLTSGTWYHLVYWTNNTGYMINYSASGANTFYKYRTYGTWPTTYGTEDGSGTSPYCMYAMVSCVNPSITAHPQSISRNIGTSATFNVSATGTSLTYQWKKNGSNISGATSSSYTINPVGSNDAANYSVVVSGACGSPVTSNSATLTVNSTITLGNYSEGTSNDNPSTCMCASRYQCFQNMTTTMMYVKIATSGSGKIKCAIYSDNSGNPGTFLMGTDELTNPGTGWKSFTLTSGLALTSGTWYHLVYWTDGTNYTINYSTSGANTHYKHQTYGTWPSSYGTEDGNGTSPYCVYITGTASVIPTITTTSISNITTTTASSGGNITSDGGASVAARGVCWSTTSNPTIANSKTTDGTGTGTFTSSITGLSQGTTYHVRAYATNSVGTAYGSDIQFTTLTTPTLTTTSVSNITSTTASSGGNISSDGGASVTARGVCWSTTSNPTIANSKTADGTGTGTFTSSITGLSQNTTYHVRAYATNSAGTSYGSDIQFTTLNTPTVTTTSVSSITTTSASSGGNVTSDGGASVSARGVCWSTTSNPTIADSKTTDGTGTGIFTSSITGLSQNTTYHVRAYATNSVGTAYGSDIQFTTDASTTIIGNNSEGTSNDDPSNCMCAGRYQCSQNMTATTMYVKIATSGSGKIKCAIYSDNSGNPGTFLMGTNELTNPGTGWKSFTLTSGLALTSGTWYHLVYWTDGTYYMINYSASGANTHYKHQTYGTWPSSYGTEDGGGTSPYCVYATGSGECTGPSITVQPQNIARAIGESATFSVTAAGTSLTYQWKKNGSDIAGQTSSSYTINNIASGDAAEYTVVVSGSCDSPVTSDTVSLLIGDYFVSTSGNDNNSGTYSQPFATWQKGFETATAGDVVYIRGGTYSPNSTNHSGVMCGVYTAHSGTLANPISISAYPGEVPILDGANITESGLHFGIWMQYSDYWNLTGLWVRNILEYYNGGSVYSPSSYNYAGSIQINDVNHITFTKCTVSGSGEGFEIGSNSDDINYINCDAFNNYDKINRGDYTNGFGGTISAGKHVSHTGCRSWNNSDDGYDYAGSVGGYITWDNCWSFLNGYTWYSDGTFLRDVNGYGDGCGYKVTMCTETSKENGAQRILRNCLSFNNLTASFDDSPANTDDPNGNNYNISRQEVNLLNCTSYNNGYTAWMNFSSAGAVDKLQNCIAFSDDYGADISANSTNNHNTWNTGFSVSSSDFLSLDTAGVTGARQADGSLPVLDFLKLDQTSNLVGAGIDVGLPYLGYNPDLGAYESPDLTKGTGSINKPDQLDGISDQIDESNSLIIYPNPVKDKLTVNFSGHENLVSLKLLDSRGIKLFEGMVPGNYILDMSSYPSGLYILHVRSGGGLIVKKVIKH